MAQVKVNGKVEELNGIGRAFSLINAAVAGTDAVALQDFVNALQALNVTIIAIGDLSGVSVNMIIDGHDVANIPAVVGGVAVSEVAF